MSHQTWSNEWIAEKRNKWVKRQSECIRTQSSRTWIWNECIFLNYNSCFFFLFLPFFLTVFTLMVTMLERERIIPTVLYVIPSGPAYVHYDRSMVWREMSDGGKKKNLKSWQGSNWIPCLIMSSESWKICISSGTISFSSIKDEKWHGENKVSKNST